MNDKRTKININHVAKLANLDLTESEKKKFGRQIEEVLRFVEQIQSVSETVKEDLEDQRLEEISDLDEPRPSLETSDALKNAPNKDGKYFKVKAIFDV